MPVKLPSDFGNEISRALNWKLEQVAEWFTLEEDKEGYFWGRLKPKKVLDKPEFKKMCALVRNLGGEDYLPGAFAWRVPGPYAKKGAEKPPGQAMDSQRGYKEPGNAVPVEPSGVTPHVVVDDKSKPPDIPNLKFIPVDAIKIPAFLPTRELISHERLSGIRESIKKHGLRYPIKVRRFNSDYELIDGYLRLKSVQQLGWKGILAEIKDATDQEVVVESLITNKHRIEEDPITVAKKLDILINAFGYTQEKLAEELGVSQPWISDSIRFLKLPREVQHYLALDNVTRYHALLLLTVKNPDLQVRLAKEVVDNGLSTRQLEERIRELQPKPKDEEKAEAGKVGEEAALRRRVESQDTRQGIPCARCGDPIQGPPVHLEGKFYCAECHEQIEAEKVPGLLPEPERVGEAPEQLHEPRGPPAVDIGGFECPECHKHFIVEHLPNGKHKLKPVREEAD